MNSKDAILKESIDNKMEKAMLKDKGKTADDEETKKAASSKSSSEKSPPEKDAEIVSSKSKDEKSRKSEIAKKDDERIVKAEKEEMASKNKKEKEDPQMPVEGKKDEAKNDEAKKSKEKEEVKDEGPEKKEEGKADPSKKDIIDVQPKPAKDVTPAQEEAGTLEDILGDGEEFVINQGFEAVETGSFWLSFGCCKVETQNTYYVSRYNSDEILMVGQESSNWLCRNPCLCCDCICWCCHSRCGKRRYFRMPVTVYPDQEGGRALFILERPYRTDCCPGLLQSITVRSATEAVIGTVQQTVHCRWNCVPACEKFAVMDAAGNTIFEIRAPCILTTFCCTQATFSILNMDGDAVGEIAKIPAPVTKEAFTDSDRFKIRFPKDINAEMKATLIGALVLFDYIYYEE